MRTGWFVQACIVLAVGVGLVSCTKEQIDQVMNRPAEIVLQSSPCTPAGIASTATPELCVNVMEIQLLRQDTQADVSLTLVNRTGQRQYIILIGEDLKDSSGTRWAPARSSGLGQGGPLPVEPNIETQGTLSFFQNGQATTGLTFSLRGEIAIYRVDSRGQPINGGPYAVKRGFTLSGIRIPQQPPQSSAPTEQKSDTKLAQASPPGVATATPKASASSQPSPPMAVLGASATPVNVDIVGLRLGMTPEEIRQTMQEHDKNFKVKEQRASLQGLPETTFLSELIGGLDRRLPVGSLDSIGAHFPPPPHKSRTIFIQRFTLKTAVNLSDGRSF